LCSIEGVVTHHSKVHPGGILENTMQLHHVRSLDAGGKALVCF